MTTISKIPEDGDLIREEEDHRSYVTTTSGMRGYFAVLMFWDEAGFWDVWQSGIGSYNSHEAAVREAKDWATAEELEYRG